MFKNEIRNSPRFLFNWNIKLKTNTDIQKRADFLIDLFKKEVEWVRNKKKKAQKEAAALEAKSRKSSVSEQGTPKSATSKKGKEIVEELPSKRGNRNDKSKKKKANESNATSVKINKKTRSEKGKRNY
jgi:hypothetical protein